MAGPTLFRPSNITSGLVGYWKLDEASGSRADSSGNGNTLTDNNTVASVAQDYWKTGENSADFEKANTEYLSITDGSQTGLDVTTAFTMACWVKPEDFNTNHTLFSKWSASSGYYFQLVDVSTKLRLGRDASSTDSSTASLASGKWSHVAVTLNSSVICFYVDGNLVSAHSTGTVSASSVMFQLGANNDTSHSELFDGLMKDAAIWNVALTPIQIKSLALGVDLASYAYRPNNVSAQPTSWWKMNELSGTRNDSIGSNHLTDNNTVTALGGYVEGVGADFESGNSEYLSAGDVLDLTGTYSICAWLKWESSSPDDIVCSKWSPSTGWMLRISSGDGGTIAVLHDNTTYSTIGTVAKGMVVGNWFHLAVVFDATADTVKFYLDGVLIDTVSSATVNPSNTTHNFNVGRRSDGSDYFDGIISDLAIWSGYTLTAAEAASLACGIPIQQTGIVSYWKLDETSGNRADIIGVNNLTDNNTVLSGTGKVSNAADFEASNSEYLSIADAPQSGLDVTDLTMLCWYKPESTGITSALFDKDGYGSGYGMLIQSTNKLNMTIANNFVDTVNTSLSAGTFYHCVGVYDGADKRVYLNSAKDGNEATTTVIADTAAVFYLGRDASGDYADGLMDEALLAKRWFRDEEIKTIYCKGLAGKELTNEEISSSGSGGSFFLMFQ